ncbi:MAG: OsmC family protein [Stellaceae bacterium]
MDTRQAAARFEVIFDAEGRNTGKFRNDIVVHKRLSHPVSVELPTDEGPGHGGDGTAPYPLAYFAAGLTACIMTQLRAFSRRLDVHVTEFTVDARCHWEATQLGNAPYESAPIAFTLDIDLGGGATEADKRRVIAAAAKGCFIEQSLKPGIVKHRLKIGENWVDV